VFDLSLPVNLSTLEITKLALTNQLPEVKSSHRCEAMARGFGYRTYASFLEDARSCSDRLIRVDGVAFGDYLGKHDFAVTGSALYRAGAMAALNSVADRFPRLTINGFGIGDWYFDDTRASRRKKFDDSRARLVSNYAVEPFLASLAFVSRIERTRTVRPATNSYWLKHIAESYECAYPTGEKLGPVYVANGVLIAAAIHAGFEVKKHTDEYGAEMLNAGFNMSKRSLYDLDCEIRPDGVRAQDRRRNELRRLAARTGMIGY
jgi:hypothetical protein